MSETIYKLQPDRTLALRGFDGFASAATIHNASPNGFGYAPKPNVFLSMRFDKLRFPKQPKPISAGLWQQEQG